jgi:hypothetical protein
MLGSVQANKQTKALPSISMLVGGIAGLVMKTRGLIRFTSMSTAEGCKAIL